MMASRFIVALPGFFYIRTPVPPAGASSARLIPALVNQCALLDPRHHGAQLGTDLLDRMSRALRAHGLERGLVDAVLQHPVLAELARLNVAEDPLHLGLGLRRHHARAGDIFAVLGGVGDR